MSEEVIVCRRNGNWIFCVARTSSCGRIMIGEQCDDDNIDFVYYDLDPLELIGIGQFLVHLGLELLDQRRKLHQLMTDEDLSYA